MPRALSHSPTLVAACFALATTTAQADPIRLAEPDRVPLNATSMVVADVDGTKGPDLVGAGAGAGSGSILISLNDGTGHFGVPLAFPMGMASLAQIAVRDLDGNGLPDLLAVSGTTVRVRLQTAPLVFAPADTYSLPAPLGWGFVLADLDHDGRPELAATCTDQVTILRNDGDGHFTSTRVLPVPGALSPPVAGDFNGDGEVDLILGTSGASPPLALLAGHGDATFAPVTAASTSCPIRIHLATADLDGDGDLDLLGTDERYVYVFAGHGDGTFDCAVQIGGGQNAYSDPVIGDIDGDGRPDVALSQRTDWFGPIGDVITFRNLGGLAFERGVRNKVAANPTDTWVGDLDGDGKADLAVLCGLNGESCFTTNAPGVTVAHNTGRGTWDTMTEVAEPVWLPARPAGSLVPDLVGATPAGELRLAHNRGNGAFDAAVAVGRGMPLAARDLDGDGDDDLIVSTGDSLSALLRVGAGFGPPHFIASGFTFRDLGDFDHDHRPDLLATAADGELVRFAGDGAGGFGPVVHLGFHAAVAPGVDDVRAGDVDHDGWDDVLYVVTTPAGAFGESTTVALSALLNDHAGGLAAPIVTSTTGSRHGPGCLRVGDWNGDGALDVLHVQLGCTDGNDHTVARFLGRGDGTFEAHAPASLGGVGSWCDARLGDLNGDHIDDEVLVNSTAGCNYHVVTSVGGPTGDFSDRRDYSMGVEPHAAYLADLDGDGRLDVVTHDERFGTTYSIRRNVTPLPVSTPTLLSLVSSSVEDGIVRLTWFADDPSARTANVERRSESGGWTTLGAATSDGSGYLRFEDPSAASGSRWAYRLRVVATGETSSEVWVDLATEHFRIAGVWPNPAVSHPVLSFAIPVAGTATIRVYDVAGRVVLRKELPGLSAGSHRLDLGEAPLRPGLYAATLEFGGRRLHTRFLLIP